MSERHALLVIRSQAPDLRFREFVEACKGTGKRVSATRLHDIDVLEPGTLPLHTLVLEFGSRQEAFDAYSSLPFTIISKPADPQVLLTAMVPESGFDDAGIPTSSNVDVTEDGDPVLLIIEGSASDQDVMDTYRDIILPIMFESQAYYTVFELGGDVEVLSGEWDEAIFAISRWPNADAALGFWLSERYQRDAIPLRLDIGKFGVVMLPDQT